MNLIEFTAINGHKISIPVDKITGLADLPADNSNGNCFVATGADTPDGGENGWYIANPYREAWVMLDTALNYGHIGVPKASKRTLMMGE